MTSSTFQHYLLAYDGSATPALEHFTAPLHPGRPLADEQSGQRLFLAGGFSSITPDSAIPLSATLQLNGDLGVHTEEQLAAIARAELTRSSASTWRSYTTKADPTVAVLADDAKQLQRFIETYGGVLDIHPLLLNGRHEEFRTAAEPLVRADRNSLHLSFLVRTPIDRERCTYCGQCGPRCPEDCLSATLFLDLERCTFCGKCVEICPTGAIDLHGAEKQALEVPALLLLGDTSLSLPEQQERIYRQDRLPALFASIFSCQIDEVITCNNNVCQYSGRLQLGCSLCFSACRHGAVLKTDRGIEIDQQRCLECGACVGVCPTGALQYHRFDDHNFITWFSDLEIEPDTTLVLGNEEDLHRFWWRNRDRRFAKTLFLEYPQVHALHLMHLLFAMSVGFHRVVLVTADTDGSELARQVAAANTVCGQLFDQNNIVCCSDHLELPSLLGEPTAALCRPFRRDCSPPTGRREKLIAILQSLIHGSGRSLTLDKTHFPTFGHLSCDTSRCTLCLACLNECRINALQADRDRFSLLHAPLLCVQCASCVALCPEKALQVRPGLQITGDKAGTTELARAEAMLCRECGRMFGTRQSHERVMALLREKNMLTDDELFGYCETCRVLKIYEGHNHE